MPLDEPIWWYNNTGTPIAARALAPFATLYGLAAKRRFSAHKPYRSRFPVVCVGNFTAGGTGKTPLALYICEALRSDGHHPVFLTRGFKGREAGPLWVDLKTHTAADVGDEPLLLARAAPTLVARDRAAGARFIESGGRRASVIIMDDGLQNPQLAKDLTIAVIDARRGLGNGAVIPAGPLRAPLAFQLALTDAIVVNGSNSEPNQTADNPSTSSFSRIRKQFSGPVVKASTQPRGNIDWLGQTPTVAFAGIANPNRFFDLLEANGARLAQRKAFPDHHVFSETDARNLLRSAYDLGARLVTTEKDLARLTGNKGKLGELAAQALTFPITVAFDPKDDIRLDELLKNLPGREAV